MNLLKSFKIEDDFFGRYERLISQSVIPYQEKALKDLVEGAEKSHAVENFCLAAEMLEKGRVEKEFYGMVFQDSDLAKWLEGAAYSLAMFPNPQLEKRCDEMIDLIGRAQHKDGYLNTYFTVKKPNGRWKNLGEAHELYCAGHMMEAAVAYAECTGKTKLLDIMCKMADHVYRHFIKEKVEGYPGHPEIELALMRLYNYTKNKKYLTLAKHFVDVRGVDENFFINEAKNAEWTVWGGEHQDKEYAQNQAPVRQQEDAVGHAVRAVYLYTGMAEIAKETKDESLKKSCQKLWKSITQKRMYITGAIGSSYEGEAFTKDYHLPNDTAYAETCASIGLIFFAQKMLALEKKGEYADVMEKALYNCVLAGMELSGERFFYVNPLEVIPGISGQAVTHRHALPQRPKWFACACCPPNVARLLPSIANYAWSVEGENVYSHLFIGGELSLKAGKIKVETKYPYSGEVCYKFKPNCEEISISLGIRLPSWSKKTAVLLNGKEVEYKNENGYVYISKAFTTGDTVTLRLDMSVRQVYSCGKVGANTGKTALTRGPLVYCAEGVDNGKDVLSLSLTKGEFTVNPFNENILSGVCQITAKGIKSEGVTELYSYEEPIKLPVNITLIPYYTWGNRGETQMRVWLPTQ